MNSQNLFIQVGATFERTINLTDANNNPLDVTGLSANATFKRDLYAANATIHTFETYLANGQMILKMEANATANLYPGWYVYDVLVTNGTDVYKIADGDVEVEGTVTTV